MLDKKAILAREKIKTRWLTKKLFPLDKELKQYGWQKICSD